jgi:hypothetical protein
LAGKAFYRVAYHVLQNPPKHHVIRPDRGKAIAQLGSELHPVSSPVTEHLADDGIHITVLLIQTG